MYKVLVIENHRPTALQLRNSLMGGYDIHCKPNLRSALEFLFTQRPEVTLIGSVENKEPTQVCKSIRRQGCEAPLICISNSTKRDSGIKMLEAGADDYLTCPLYGPEVQARVSRMISRPPFTRQKQISVANITVIPDKLGVINDRGEEVELKPREFEVLRCLVENTGSILSRGQLVSKTSAPHQPASEAAIDVHISNLRKKLQGIMAADIQSVYGVGYRLLG